MAAAEPHPCPECSEPVHPSPSHTGYEVWCQECFDGERPCGSGLSRDTAVDAWNMAVEIFGEECAACGGFFADYRVVECGPSVLCDGCYEEPDPPSRQARLAHRADREGW